MTVALNPVYCEHNINQIFIYIYMCIYYDRVTPLLGN